MKRMDSQCIVSLTERRFSESAVCFFSLTEEMEIEKAGRRSCDAYPRVIRSVGAA